MTAWWKKLLQPAAVRAVGERSAAVNGDAHSPIVTGDNVTLTIHPPGPDLKQRWLEWDDLVGRVQTPRSPSSLLEAHRAVVPFRGRADVLEELGAWCAEPGFGVHLVYGPGGQGKTRLARRFTDGLQEGWNVLWLGQHASVADLPAAQQPARPDHCGRRLRRSAPGPVACPAARGPAQPGRDTVQGVAAGPHCRRLVAGVPGTRPHRGPVRGARHPPAAAGATRHRSRQCLSPGRRGTGPGPATGTGARGTRLACPCGTRTGPARAPITTPRFGVRAHPAYDCTRRPAGCSRGRRRRRRWPPAAVPRSGRVGGGAVAEPRTGLLAGCW